MRRASIWLNFEDASHWWAEVIENADTDDATQLHVTGFCPSDDAAIEAARQWMRENGVEEVEE